MTDDKPRRPPRPPNDKSPAVHLLLPTAFGLEAVVAREAESLGFESVRRENGRVIVETTDPLAIPRLNLTMRTAGRVQILVARFECRDFGTLFDRTVLLPWEEGIEPRGAFPVSGRCVRSQLHSEPDVQRTVKKAIATRLSGRKDGVCPEDGPTYPIRIGIDRDEALLTIDTTGDGLHRRGYRTRPGAAALRETMAASLLQLSHWRPGRPLVDPFCGTGTILIEAAWMQSGRAPGLRRTFVSEDWKRLPLSTRHPSLLWSAARDEAQSQQRSDAADTPLVGCDIDPRQLAIARDAAERAGVADRIVFRERDVAALRPDGEYGCVVTNPPYGQRLHGSHMTDAPADDAETLRAMYQALADRVADLPTWGTFLLTAYPELEAVFGRSADRRRNLYNGPIACTYYQYFGPRPPRPPRPDAT